MNNIAKKNKTLSCFWWLFNGRSYCLLYQSILTWSVAVSTTPNTSSFSNSQCFTFRLCSAILRSTLLLKSTYIDFWQLNSCPLYYCKVTFYNPEGCTERMCLGCNGLKHLFGDSSQQDVAEKCSPIHGNLVNLTMYSGEVKLFNFHCHHLIWDFEGRHAQIQLKRVNLTDLSVPGEILTFPKVKKPRESRQLSWYMLALWTGEVRTSNEWECIDSVLHFN